VDGHSCVTVIVGTISSPRWVVFHKWVVVFLTSLENVEYCYLLRNKETILEVTSKAWQ